MSIKDKYQEVDASCSKLVKTALNHAYGRFSMKPFDKKTTLCHNRHELSSILLGSEDTLHILPISSDLVDVMSLPKPTNRRRPNTCITLGAHIIGFARKLLHERMNEIKEKFTPASLFMLNTDAAVISIPKSQNISKLSFSPYMGDWKNQIKDCHEIQKFFCMSPVKYHISYITKEGQNEQITKVAGYSLNNVIAPGVESNNFENLLKKAIREEKKDLQEKDLQEKAIRQERGGIVIDQIRKKNLPGFITKETKIEFCLKSSLDKKRVNCEDFLTLPYGFRN